jgi:hypothetical protein
VFADASEITEVTIGKNIRRIGEDVGIKAADWAQVVEEYDGESSPTFGACESLTDFHVADGNEVFEEIGGCLFYRDTPNDAKTLALYPSGRTELAFPEGVTVTAIGDGACAWCHGFTNVVIPESVRTIGLRSFDFCREVVTLSIPDGVEEIGWRSFQMLISLFDLEVAGSVETIGERAFYHSFMGSWKNGGRLVLHDGIETIGPSAFEMCMYLVEASVGAREIGLNAFSECYWLTTLTLSDAVESIRAGAFCECYELPSLTVPASVRTIELSKEDDGSYGGAFANCEHLKEIRLPDTLHPDTEGETLAFLANVFDGLGLETMSAEERDAILTWYPAEGGDFAFVVNNKTVVGFTGTCPATIGAAEWPDGIEYIGMDAFNGCTTLRHLTLPAGIREIEWHAFLNCLALESVDLSNSFGTLTDIGGDAFNGCTALKSLVLDGQGLDVWSGAFYACTSLETLEIGSGVDVINIYAFGACRSLATVINHATGAAIDETAFIGTEYYRNMPFSFITKPDWDDRLAVAGFKGVCPAEIAAADWPSGVEAVADRAFPYCDDLRSVEFPASFARISAGTFACCTNLASVTFPATNTTDQGYLEIGHNAFALCSNLRSVTLRGPLEVSQDVFAGCAGLEDVTVEEGVTFIDSGAFARTGVRSIVLPAGMNEMSAESFAGNDGDFTVYVPRSAADNYGIEEGDVEYMYTPRVFGLETEERWAEYGFVAKDTTAHIVVRPYGGSAPVVSIDTDRMQPPVLNSDGTRTIAAQEGVTLTEDDLASVTVASPLDGSDITEAYGKALEDNAIILSLARPSFLPEGEYAPDADDPSGMLDDVSALDPAQIAAPPEPAPGEEAGALPVKMYPGLGYQAEWGGDLDALSSGARFQATGTQTHIGVVKQKDGRGFYRVFVSETP